MAEPRAELARKSGQMLKDLVSASNSRLRESRERGEDAMRYYKAHDYDFIYNTVDCDLFFKSCVKKVWEAFTIIIGYITPEAPHRTIAVSGGSYAPGSEDADRNQSRMARLSVVERMLNWSVKETDFAKHIRRVILDTLARGRGVMWTGIHPNKDVVTSMWDSELNFSCDPNAMIDEDVMWKGRTMVMPRSRAINMYPQAAQILKRTPKCGQRFDLSCSSMVNNELDGSLDCVKLHTIYMKNAITEYGSGSELKAAIRLAGVSESDMEAQLLNPAPLRYTVTDDGMLVDVSPWEVPLWKDGLWPCTELVTFDDNTSRTPISPLDAAVKFTHAINWMSSLMLGKARTTMRLGIAMVEHNGQGLNEESKYRALLGKDLEAIVLKAFGDDGNADINKYIQQIKWDNSWISPMMQMIQFYERKFDEMSGITHLMRSGEVATQDRSAEATRLRRDVSFNRIDDMKNAVSHFHDEVARKESIYLQYLKDGSYIAERLGKQAALDYGFLADDEAKDPLYWINKFMEDGAMPSVAQEQGRMRALRAYTLNDILHEAEYSTVVGEGPRHNRQARLDAYDRMLNQTAPTLMQTGDPMDAAIVFDMQAAFFKEVGGDERQIANLEARAEQLRGMAEQAAQQAQMQQMQPQQEPMQ